MIKITKLKKEFIDGINIICPLRDINLCLPDKGLFSIVGPSGCGKTTLLNLLGLLDKPTAGEIYIDDINTSLLNEKELNQFRQNKIGYVHQNGDLLNQLNVIENVLLPCSILGNKKRKYKDAIRLLNFLGLGDRSNSNIKTLSGGEVQRIAIARALINNPRLILADEPTGFLDNKNAFEIMDYLKKISKDKLVIVVTHNIDLATKFSDSIINLQPTCNFIPKLKESNIVKSFINTKQRFTIESLKLGIKNVRSRFGKFLLMILINLVGITTISSCLATKNGVSKTNNTAIREIQEGLPIEISTYYSNVLDGVISVLNNSPYVNSNIINVIENTVNRNRINYLSDEYINYLKSNINNNLIKEKYDVTANLIGIDTNSTPYVIEAKNKSTINNFTDAFTMSSTAIQELPNTKENILKNMDIVDGDFPKNKNEAILVIDPSNLIPQNLKFALGINKDSFTYSEVLGKDYKFVPNNDIYNDSGIPATSVNGYFLKSKDDLKKMGANPKKVETNLLYEVIYYMKGEVEKAKKIRDENKSYFLNQKESRNIKSYSKYASLQKLKDLYDDNTIGEHIKIVGILKRKKGTIFNTLSQGIYYTNDTTKMFIEKNKNSNISQEMYSHMVLQDPDVKLTINIPDFYGVIDKHDKITFTNPIESITNIYNHFNVRSELLCDDNVSFVNIITNNNSEKNTIKDILNKYNNGKSEENKIEFMDMASSFDSIVDIFVNIFNLVIWTTFILVLISILIINVLVTLFDLKGRTKEIGIYRSLGASKKFITSTILTEKTLLALTASLISIAVSLGVIAIINACIRTQLKVCYIEQFAFMNPLTAFIIILISIVSIVISAIIPIIIYSRRSPSKTIKNID